MPDDDGPEEFQYLLYCYFCLRRLNQSDDTEEVEPQTCAHCARENLT